MTKFSILLEDGSLLKDVLIKIGSKYAKNNADVYWFVKSCPFIEVYRDDETYFCKIDVNDIYYYTISEKY